MTIQGKWCQVLVKLGGEHTNLPKILPMPLYHHSHFLAVAFDFPAFLSWPFGPHTFLTAWLFWYRYTLTTLPLQLSLLAFLNWVNFECISHHLAATVITSFKHRWGTLLYCFAWILYIRFTYKSFISCNLVARV